ncbi:MAG: hypothetical protein ABR562_07815 [Thermoplasmatota archaeon]
MGAKVHPRMYADMEHVAALQRIGLSDVIRQGIALFLQANGVDQGLRVDAEALTAAQQRLQAYEDRAAALVPKMPAKAALRLLREQAGSQYRNELLTEVARTHPEEVAAAVRMWRNPSTRHILMGASLAEPNTPLARRSEVGPPVLRPLRALMGSYAALREALVAETGVAA